MIARRKKNLLFKRGRKTMENGRKWKVDLKGKKTQKSKERKSVLVFPDLSLTKTKKGKKSKNKKKRI